MSRCQIPSPDAGQESSQGFGRGSSRGASQDLRRNATQA